MIVTCTTTDVAHGGYCVARVDSRVFFVSGALPGETVDVEVTRRQSRQWFGTVVLVREASPDRIEHIWPLAERTGVGGADLGHVTPEAGRRWKGRVIETQMARLAHLAMPVKVEEAPGDADRAGLAWRTRVSFACGPSGTVGMIAAKSHRFVPVDSMPLAHEDIQTVLGQDVAMGVPGAANGVVSYVRSSGGVTRVVHSGREARGRRPPVDELSVAVTEVVPTSVGDLTYRVEADGFWQVHRMAPSVLVEAVREAVGDGVAKIWDLYAGAGLFTVALARSTQAPVVAVEGSLAGARCLRANTDPDQVTCLRSDVAEALAGLEPSDGGVVVCDPPRSGLGSDVVSGIVGLNPQTIVYVACDPASLARDIDMMSRQDYRLESLRAFDLFPHTHHVESVARLVRSGV